jgi:hypothetical protein
MRICSQSPSTTLVCEQAPNDDGAELFSQIFTKAKRLFENLNEIRQSICIPNEVIANQPIVRVIAKINVTKILASLLSAFLFRPLNLLTQIIEALPQGFQKGHASFSLALVEKSNIQSNRLRECWLKRGAGTRHVMSRFLKKQRQYHTAVTMTIWCESQMPIPAPQIAPESL